MKTKEKTVAQEAQKSITKSEIVDIGKIVWHTFLVSCLAILVLVFWFMSVTFALDPEFSIKVFDFVGANNASLAAYERIYHKSNDPTDLYNAVVKSISLGKDSKTLSYINELRGREDYAEFVQEFNDYATDGIENQYIAYVGDVDGYLVSRKVIALYNLGRDDEARDVAIKDLDNENIYSVGLTAYIDSLAFDSEVSNVVFDNTLRMMANISLREGVNLVSGIQLRLQKASVSAGTTLQDRILRVYTCIKLNNVLLDIYKAQGLQDEVTQCEASVRALQNTYYNLIEFGNY